MKNYESPVVLANENLAEGVFAASGATNVSTGEGGCWTFNRATFDNYNEQTGYANFHVYYLHNTNNDHSSSYFGGTLYVSGDAGLEDVAIDSYDNFTSIKAFDNNTIKFENRQGGNPDNESISFQIALKSKDEKSTRSLNIDTGSCDYCVRK